MKIRLVHFKGCLYGQAFVNKMKKLYFCEKMQLPDQVANQKPSCVANESHVQMLALWLAKTSGKPTESSMIDNAGSMRFVVVFCIIRVQTIQIQQIQ